MTEVIEDGAESVYRRELPGGGYVAIDVTHEHAIPRTRVSVQRRAIDAADGADDGNTADQVVIAEVDGDEKSESFTGMYRIAADNAAIARAILEMKGTPRAD